ncbi:MAG: ComF family protein [Candidatus Taylorbacteria bacterium]|nr:ComF family protein [Candidatus Taylorbacteria bacterium]
MNARNILEYLLNILLPKPEKIIMVENMSPEELRSLATLPIARQNALPKNFFSVLNYKTSVTKNAIWELKYRSNTKIAELLAGVFYEEIVEQLHERKLSENFDKPMLIPIPISKERLAERGWNQCDIIADKLRNIDNGNFFEVDKNVLIKIRDTESQTKKDRSARLKDLKGCFAVQNSEKIAGKNVILIDDVLTTGATFEEAGKTLLNAGARKIVCASLAH